jgi:hypothetical protein
MNPEEQLDSFISKFTPEIAALTVAVLAKMRERLPHAIQLVYDNYNALAIGFGPSERASEGIFSIAVFPRQVNLCFLQGGVSELFDPNGLLHGSGSLNRYVPLNGAATLDDPAVRNLMEQAAAAAKVPFNESTTGYLVIKSVSAKQRPRRPG